MQLAQMHGIRLVNVWYRCNVTLVGVPMIYGAQKDDCKHLLTTYVKLVRRLYRSCKQIIIQRYTLDQGGGYRCIDYIR